MAIALSFLKLLNNFYLFANIPRFKIKQQFLLFKNYYGLKKTDLSNITQAKCCVDDRVS